MWCRRRSKRRKDEQFFDCAETTEDLCRLRLRSVGGPKSEDWPGVRIILQTGDKRLAEKRRFLDGASEDASLCSAPSTRLPDRTPVEPPAAENGIPPRHPSVTTRAHCRDAHTRQESDGSLTRLSTSLSSYSVSSLDEEVSPRPASICAIRFCGLCWARPGRSETRRFASHGVVSQVKAMALLERTRQESMEQPGGPIRGWKWPKRQRVM